MGGMYAGLLHRVYTLSMNEDKVQIVGMTIFSKYRMLLAQCTKTSPLYHTPCARSHFSHILTLNLRYNLSHRPEFINGLLLT